MEKITFENPNTPEDMARYLPKILAELILLKLKGERAGQPGVHL